MIRRFTNSILEMILTSAAFVWVMRFVIAEIISATLVVYGISLIYTPAGYIAAGVLFWAVAKRIEAYVSQPTQ